MNLPTRRLATRIASAALFSLAAASAAAVHVRADTPHLIKPASTPSPVPSTPPCTDCPPIVIGHPKGGDNPFGIVVGPEELRIWPSPRALNGHVYSVTKSGNITSVSEDGVAKMTITFRGNKAYIGLPGSKPLVEINVAP